MNTRVLAGQYLNLLERVASGNITASSSDTLFPLTNLPDGRASRPWKAANLNADQTITVDGNLLPTPTFDTWSAGVVVGYTNRSTGTGTIAQTSVAGEFRSGSAAKIGGGASGVGRMAVDKTVRSGEYMEIRGWMRGDGTQAARYRIYNPTTGHYLQGDGTWATSAADLGTVTSSTYAEQSKQFQVESVTVIQGPLTTIRLELVCTQNGFGYFDDWVLYPGVDFAGVFGHNLDPIIVPELHSSTDNFAANDTTEATLSMRQPAFYGLLGSRTFKRYWRLKLSGTQYTAAAAIGELVIGQSFTLALNPKHPESSPWETKYSDPMMRKKTDAGESWKYARTEHEARVLKLPFLNRSMAQYTEIRDEIMRRCRFGLYQIVLIPVDNEDTVVFGELEKPEWSVRRLFDNTPRHEHDIYVSELPFFTSTT